MAIVINGDTGITATDASEVFGETLTIDGLTVGQGAGNVATNTAVGVSALASNTTGGNEVAIGQLALNANTSGDRNTAIGSLSLRLNTTGNYNVASGYASLYNNTTGSNNTSYGYAALIANTTANNNTAVGYQAGYSNTTAGVNVYVGYQAGYTNSLSQNNVFVGNQAGYTHNVGSLANGFNTYVGAAAGYSATTGTNNTFVGSGPSGLGAGYYVTTGSKNTILGGYNGNQGGLDIRTASNYIVLSDGDGNPRQIINNVGRIYTHAGTANTNLSGALNLTGEVGASYYAIAFNHVGGGSQVGSISTGASSTSYNTSSDYRLKTDIQPVTGAVDRVKALNPVNFEWINSEERVDGFIAHEAAEVVPEAVHGTKDAVDSDGNPVYQGIDQSKLVPLLTAALKEAISRIEQLEADVAALKGQ